MASNTENLDLLMKNPSTDGADTFNVQTMLNENWQKIDKNAGTVAQTLANILKPTTPPIIGLPSSATPNDMFNAMAHAGDLHVWRKTVVNASEKPAGYTLGAETTKTLGLTRNNDSSSWAITVELASSVSVDDAGNVTLVSPTKHSIYAYNEFSDLFSGKFFKLYSIGSYVTESELYNNEVYFVPSGNKLILRADTSGSKFYLDLGIKLVTGYAKIHAGTTATYPVSTNRNAYQEGNDAKPAGYVVGEVVTGAAIAGAGYAATAYCTLYTSDTVSVAEDGTVTLVAPANPTYQMRYWKNYSSEIAGKFVRDQDSPSTVYYIPADVTISYDGGLIVSKCQPVTGYAAIPANTTIEYLGCLGDKARVQVVSYVGTGTYGSSNPNSLTFDFVPKMVFIFSQLHSNAHVYNASIVPDAGVFSTYITSDGDNTRSGFCNITRKNKTITWYRNDVGVQLNISGVKYFAVAIG